MEEIEDKTVEKDLPAVVKPKGSMLNKIFGILTAIVALAAIAIAVYAFIINRKMKEFKQFDLKELSSQELIFQTYEFNKFIAYGTADKRILGEYTDEMNVYFVKGVASISFKNIDKLKPVWEVCDYENGILRLEYTRDGQDECPFDVDITIAPENIFYVAGKESKTIEVPLFQKEIDLIKPENPADTIQRTKDEIQKEFEKQLLEPFKSDKSAQENLCVENDTYAAFLNSLTEVISSKSKWKNVEIFFK